MGVKEKRKSSIKRSAKAVSVEQRGIANSSNLRAAKKPWCSGCCLVIISDDGHRSATLFVICFGRKVRGTACEG